jgi:flagellar basal body-associated protein FliL
MARVKVDKVEPAKVRSRVEWIALGVSIVLVTAAVVSMMRMLGQ